MANLLKLFTHLVPILSISVMLSFWVIAKLCTPSLPKTMSAFATACDSLVGTRDGGQEGTRASASATTETRRPCELTGHVMNVVLLCGVRMASQAIFAE